MEEPKQVIVIRKDLGMRKGKIASQVSHASMMFLVRTAELSENRLNIEEYGNPRWNFWQVVDDKARKWLTGSFVKIVAGVNSGEELRNLVEQAKKAGIHVDMVVDEGRTEFGGVATLTCAAFGPAYSSELDPITGHLPLL